jgi:hypothetical protein
VVTDTPQPDPPRRRPGRKVTDLLDSHLGPGQVGIPGITLAGGRGELATVGATLSAPDQHHHQLPVLAPLHWDEHRRAPNLDVLVRNFYKLLLTRGLIGCVIYSTDPETRALLAKLGVSSA